MFHKLLKRICILWLLGKVFYKCPLNGVHWWCCSFLLRPCSIWVLILSIALRGTEFLISNCGSVYFSSQFHPLFASCIWNLCSQMHADVGLLRLLMDWTFQHFVMPFFIPGMLLDLKSSVSDTTIATLSFELTKPDKLLIILIICLQRYLGFLHRKPHHKIMIVWGFFPIFILFIPFKNFFMTILGMTEKDLSHSYHNIILHHIILKSFLLP